MKTIFKHYKGGIYNVIGQAENTETGEEMIVYEGDGGTLYVRPFKEFFEIVKDVDGNEVRRFERVGTFYK